MIYKIMHVENDNDVYMIHYIDHTTIIAPTDTNSRAAPFMTPIMIVDIDEDMCTHANNVAPLRICGGSHIDVLIGCNSIVLNNTSLSHRDTE